jgi:hypothetical protein
MIRKSYWTESHSVPGFITRHSVPREYKYGHLDLQVEGVWNLKQKNMVASPGVLGPDNDGASKDQQQL